MDDVSRSYLTTRDQSNRIEFIDRMLVGSNTGRIEGGDERFLSLMRVCIRSRSTCTKQFKTSPIYCFLPRSFSPTHTCPDLGTHIVFSTITSIRYTYVRTYLPSIHIHTQEINNHGASKGDGITSIVPTMHLWIREAHSYASATSSSLSHLF